ncbi:Hint domain-containing protein, partial [Nostocoides sp.]
MTNPQPSSRTGWWRLLLAALAAALIGLLGAGTASAATAPAAETRVGASTPATSNVVGVHESVSAGQRWGHAPPQAETVVATGVAAKTESRVLSKVDDLPCNCFVAGTTVQTSKGAKPIEGVRPGDQVWAKNRTTGKNELRPVTGLFQKKSTTLMTITLASGATVVVTQEHPFMV